MGRSIKSFWFVADVNIAPVVVNETSRDRAEAIVRNLPGGSEFSCLGEATFGMVWPASMVAGTIQPTVVDWMTRSATWNVQVTCPLWLMIVLLMGLLGSIAIALIVAFSLPNR